MYSLDMKQGMDKNTGKMISGLAYLRQRFEDTFTTRIGDLVVERGYGCSADDLIDENITPEFRLKLFSLTVSAIQDPVNGLDDLTPRQFGLSEISPNTVQLSAYCLWNNEAVTLTAPLGIGGVA